jgi:hypothetical protein
MRLFKKKPKEDPKPTLDPPTRRKCLATVFEARMVWIEELNYVLDYYGRQDLLIMNRQEGDKRFSLDDARDIMEQYAIDMGWLNYV